MSFQNNISTPTHKLIKTEYSQFDKTSRQNQYTVLELYFDDNKS